MKNYRILRDRRQHGDGLHHAVHAVARMHTLALSAGIQPKDPVLVQGGDGAA
jgi:hypothetical protein